MQHFVSCLAFATFVSLVSAHTQIWYPEWRADSFDLPFSQRIYPCAGISDNATTPRTEWPLTGGSLNVTLHDAAAYIFINLGFGANSSDFNVTLFSAPLNETGPGNLCFPKLTLPPGLPIQEGTQASIQFATAGHNGEGLYNLYLGVELIGGEYLCSFGIDGTLGKSVCGRVVASDASTPSQWREWTSWS
ncbi:hypothetical protein FOPE_02645 [Fonsecaea pedrosoi]|nr:hypothetical protein FOPE_02645 [Fonsecaea pedrosoi]